ncbi:putative fructose-2,6-bisphosphatase TIGAR A [Genypterus blacodes]|uniref:putative fructose-2,6-bisphosphatase TIGAR A n=1 Tax=Genypterus blacodes TaxID=154954 RepID=UPI003F7704F1
MFIHFMRHSSVITHFQNMTTLTFGLTLVRHGQTQYNKDGLLQGQKIDSPLSDRGLQEAEAAGRYLKDVTFTNVFVSDMLRAQQTAETIMKHNRSCSGLQMERDPLLKERSFGIIEGKLVQDLKDMAEAAGVSYLEFTPAGGESQEQVKERVKGFLQHMLQRVGTEHWQTEVSSAAPVEGKADDGVKALPVHALVVSHGAYIRVAMSYFVEELHCSLPQGLDKSHMLSLCPNTGVCRFIVTMRKEEDRFALSGIQCVFVHRAEHVKQL